VEIKDQPAPDGGWGNVQALVREDLEVAASLAGMTWSWGARDEEPLPGAAMVNIAGLTGQRLANAVGPGDAL